MKKNILLIICLLFANFASAQSISYVGTSKKTAKVKLLSEGIYHVVKVYDSKTLKVLSASSAEDVISISKGENDRLVFTMGYEDKEFGLMSNMYWVDNVKIFTNRIEFFQTLDEKPCLTLVNSKDKTKVILKEHYVDGTSACYELKK